MSTVADRFAILNDRFAALVAAVPPDGWDSPAPCDGWVARDVVRHMVDWVPGFLAANADVHLSPGPSVDDDPAGAWTALAAQIAALLDDPARAEQEFSDEHLGDQTVEQALSTIFLGDLLIHTWDLARATGQDETLDPTEVHDMYLAMEPFEEVLRSSGQFGPRVEVPADADEQTKLIAFTGRLV